MLLLGPSGAGKSTLLHALAGVLGDINDDGEAGDADESGSLLFSSFDYGGAWQGAIGKVDAAEARERVRGAQEFGLNILAFAAYRRRRFELEKLSSTGGKNA